MKTQTLKVCGITRSIDAEFCIELGIDALGFIFHPSSPRNLSIDQFQRRIATVDFKECLKVAVAVSPKVSFINQLIDAGFDKFQFHFSTDQPYHEISLWSDLVGSENLWLAPRLKKSEEFPSKYLEYAKVFLLDAYSDKAYGGTGQLADWNKFVNLKKQFSEHQWFLAGGLGPSNLLEALISVCPDGIDLNSGVESEPGLKDNHKISEAFSIFKNIK